MVRLEWWIAWKRQSHGTAWKSRCTVYWVRSATTSTSTSWSA